MKITLLRHGKPESMSGRSIPAKAMGEWINSYNLAGLAQNEKPSYKCLVHVNGCQTIISSDFQRSIDSVKKISLSKNALADKLFREAGLPYANWGYPKLHPKIWLVLFRLFWFIGYANNSESKNQAKQRARSAALKLVELAEEQQLVLFVGHGIFNRYVARELRALGWSGPRNPGSAYWEYQVYEKLATVKNYI